MFFTGRKIRTENAFGANSMIDIKRIVTPMKNAIKGLVSRSIVKSVDDTGEIQSLQLELCSGELKDGVKRYQNYGFSSNPPIESEGVAVLVGASKHDCIAVNVENRKFRFKNMKSGEVVLYTDEGDSIAFKRDHKIMIDASEGGHVQINSSEVSITGNLTVDGNINGNSDVVIKKKLEVSGKISGAESLEVKKDLEVKGSIQDKQGSLEKIRTTYNGHAHGNAGADRPIPQMVP